MSEATEPGEERSGTKPHNHTSKETPIPSVSRDMGQVRKPPWVCLCCHDTSASSLAGSLGGHEARICSGKEGGTPEGGLINTAGPMTSAHGPGVVPWFSAPVCAYHTPRRDSLRLGRVPGVPGATSWSLTGAAGQGHRRCPRRTLGSAGRAPTRPSPCCTPARCPSHC